MSFWKIEEGIEKKTNPNSRYCPEVFSPRAHPPRNSDREMLKLFPLYDYIDLWSFGSFRFFAFDSGPQTSSVRHVIRPARYDIMYVVFESVVSSTTPVCVCLLAVFLPVRMSYILEKPTDF